MNFRQITIKFFMALGGIVFSTTSFAFPWDKDMRDQPSVKAQETVVQEPDSSVPVQGKELLPPAKGMKDIVYARLAARALNNPFAANAASVDHGKELYEIHWVVCHGSEGTGDGLVGMKFTPTPMDLTLLYVQNQPDGQLYYTITNGSLVMPGYREAIDSDDRWHIANYVKKAFGNDE